MYFKKVNSSGRIVHGKVWITWCSEGGELVEKLCVFLLAAHAAHCAHTQRQVPDQPACGQLIQLQDVLHVVEIVDQQVTLVHTGHKAYES